MSDQYSQIDVSDPREPDYMTHFDKPIVIPCYERWSKGTEPTIEQLDEEAAYYVDHG